MNFPTRQERVMRLIGEKLNGLLITHPADVRYLTGFTGSNAVLVLGLKRTTLFTDGRYTQQAKAEAIGTKVVIVPKGVLAAACIAAAGLNRCGFDAVHTTVAALGEMRAAVKALPGLPPGARRGLFVASASIVAGLRQTKDEDEIVTLRRAAMLGCGLFDALLEYIQAGLAEAEIAAELEHRARFAGAESMSFETIVASGQRSALPHGRATRAKLPRNGFLTIDFGVVVDGYNSDMTRTVHLGKASAEEFAVYDAVLEAQEAAVAAIAPGVTAGDVDNAARSVLRRAKLDKYFTHSTGHGVGLEIHEGPRLGKEQKQKLAQGMVVTVEPGVYLPGRFGVRIEDMVLVTASGAEVLTPSAKAWTQL